MTIGQSTNVGYAFQNQTIVEQLFISLNSNTSHVTQIPCGLIYTIYGNFYVSDQINIQYLALSNLSLSIYKVRIRGSIILVDDWGLLANLKVNFTTNSAAPVSIIRLVPYMDSFTDLLCGSGAV